MSVEAGVLWAKLDQGEVPVTVEELRALLAGADWYYAMSDDHGVYMRWSGRMHRLRQAARKLGEAGMRAYNEEHQKAWDTPGRSWKPPFPEAWTDAAPGGRGGDSE